MTYEIRRADRYIGLIEARSEIAAIVKVRNGAMGYKLPTGSPFSVVPFAREGCTIEEAAWCMAITRGALA